jgi:Predicted methyltransferases
MGHLILLPNLLDDEADIFLHLPAATGQIVVSLQGLIAESEKPARRYLRRFLTHDQMAALPLQTLNEHSPITQVDLLLEPILRGETWGLISDAGLPCIADPGSDLVAKAQKKRSCCSNVGWALFDLNGFAAFGFYRPAFCFSWVLAERSSSFRKTNPRAGKKIPSRFFFSNLD